MPGREGTVGKGVGRSPARQPGPCNSNGLDLPERAVLRHMHEPCILMHMRTTLIIDEELVKQARELTGIQEKTALVKEGLRALIARESARWLAAQGGTQPKLRDIPRRRLA
jgi:Arc/MetJ family transcription regulator